MTYPLLGTFCGRNLPEPVRSSGNHMFVQFQSDSSISYGGFKEGLDNFLVFVQIAKKF